MLRNVNRGPVGDTPPLGRLQAVTANSNAAASQNRKKDNRFDIRKNPQSGRLGLRLHPCPLQATGQHSGTNNNLSEKKPAPRFGRVAAYRPDISFGFG
jgi:hypothetical protein